MAQYVSCSQVPRLEITVARAYTGKIKRGAKNGGPRKIFEH